MEMSQKRMNIGIVGVGHLGNIHAKNVICHRAVNAIGYFDPKPIESIPENLNDWKRYLSLGALLRDADAIIIATPTPTHSEIALRAMKRGVHCLIEKPIADTVLAAQNVVSCAEKNKIIATVGHVERFNPAWTYVNSQHLKPRFLEVHRLASFTNRSTEIAVVLDLMIHDIDLVLWLTNSKISSIQANGVSVVTDKIDIATARIVFQSGCVANLTASRISTKSMRKIRIFQQNKYVGVDLLDKSVEDISIGSKPTKNIENLFDKKLHVAKNGNAILEEQKDFIAAIRQQKLPKVPAADGLTALKIALEIEEIINRSR